MFKNDYNVLCHERILNAFAHYYNEENEPYGNDIHSFRAKEYIRKEFKAYDSDVYFLVGGTQTNMTTISYALRDYEGVISVDSGHINVHETAAVEGSGHKIYTVKGHNGKIYPNDILEALKVNNSCHAVKLKMVYISDSTEIGTIYSRQELINLYNCCKQNNLYLFLDGARLAVALTAETNDIKPEDLAKYTDVFYIGGTKNGMMFGEALVINNNCLKENFDYHIKNKGAMLAKGFGAGIQFEEMFKDGLYFELGKKSNETASYLVEKFNDAFHLNIKGITNQIFVSLPKTLALNLIKTFGCELWSDNGPDLTIRFVTSFVTTFNDVDKLISYIKSTIK